MFRNSLIICISLAIVSSLATAAEVPPSQSKLSAAEIVEKNIAARGGLQAWRSVQTMSMQGKLGAGGNQRTTLPVQGKRPSESVVPSRPTKEAQLPFVMELKRSRKMRFELQFNGQTAIQVFDGANGWKLRPYLNRLEVEPYTPEELKSASTQADLDGPLVDYAAKGTQVELQGVEKVEDRDTYKLKLTLNSGYSTHVWIDAQTFLEAKMEGQPRRLDGTMHPVEVYYRDYRPVGGLQIPYVLETRVLPVAPTAMGLKSPVFPAENIVIEKVAVNPKLDETLFTKPVIGTVARTK
jgi:hypothetical protein